MKALIVITVELPDPDALVAVLDAVDAPRIPHFAGKVRVTVDPYASQIEAWLDDDEGTP